MMTVQHTGENTSNNRKSQPNNLGLFEKITENGCGFAVINDIRPYQNQAGLFNFYFYF